MTMQASSNKRRTVEQAYLIDATEHLKMPSSTVVALLSELFLDQCW